MRGPLMPLLLLLLSIPAFAQIPLRGIARRDSPRNVVSSYCRMDYDGARLAKDSWPRLKPLTTWKENPDWQSFTIISQYDILSDDESLRTASVSVRYTVLGRFEPGIGYSPEPGRENVAFLLREADSAWKVDELDPPINPHISKVRAVAWLKNALAGEKDAGNRLVFERALKALGN